MSDRPVVGMWVLKNGAKTEDHQAIVVPGSVAELANRFDHSVEVAQQAQPFAALEILVSFPTPRGAPAIDPGRPLPLSDRQLSVTGLPEGSVRVPGTAMVCDVDGRRIVHSGIIIPKLDNNFMGKAIGAEVRISGSVTVEVGGAHFDFVAGNLSVGNDQRSSRLGPSAALFWTADSSGPGDTCQAVSEVAADRGAVRG